MVFVEDFEIGLYPVPFFFFLMEKQLDFGIFIFYYLLVFVGEFEIGLYPVPIFLLIEKQFDFGFCFRKDVLKSLVELTDCFGVLENCKMMSSVTSSEFMML